MEPHETETGSGEGVGEENLRSLPEILGPTPEFFLVRDDEGLARIPDRRQQLFGAEKLLEIEAVRIEGDRPGKIPQPVGVNPVAPTPMGLGAAGELEGEPARRLELVDGRLDDLGHDEVGGADRSRHDPDRSRSLSAEGGRADRKPSAGERGRDLEPDPCRNGTEAAQDDPCDRSAREHGHGKKTKG